MIVLWTFHGVTAKRGAAAIPVLEAAGTPAWKVMLAGISTGLSAYLYYSGVNLLPASVAIVILMNYTWMCLLIERLAFRKKPVRAQLISVALVLAGTLLAGGMLNDKLLVRSGRRNAGNYVKAYQNYVSTTVQKGISLH
jgi:uncharacterized membrane protein